MLLSHTQAMRQEMVSALCWFHVGGMQRDLGPPASKTIREASLAHLKSLLGSENPWSASRGGAGPELRPAGQLPRSWSWSPPIWLPPGSPGGRMSYHYTSQAFPQESVRARAAGGGGALTHDRSVIHRMGQEQKPWGRLRASP